MEEKDKRESIVIKQSQEAGRTKRAKEGKGRETTSSLDDILLMNFDPGSF